MSAHWAMKAAKKLRVVLAKYDRQELFLAGSLLLVIAGVFVWSIYMLLYDNYDPATKAAEEKADKAALEMDARSFEEMLEKESHRELMSGSCPKYNWTQKNDELEMFVHLDGIEESDEDRLSKKEVEVVFCPHSLRVVVRGQTLVEGKLFAEVDPEECNWQFYSESLRAVDPSLESVPALAARTIWITLAKKRLALQVKDYWKCVLESDQVVKTTAGGAPVFSVSSGDDVRRALRAMKASKKES